MLIQNGASLHAGLHVGSMPDHAQMEIHWVEDSHSPWAENCVLNQSGCLGKDISNFAHPIVWVEHPTTYLCLNLQRDACITYQEILLLYVCVCIYTISYTYDIWYVWYIYMYIYIIYIWYIYITYIYIYHIHIYIYDIYIYHTYIYICMIYIHIYIYIYNMYTWYDMIYAACPCWLDTRSHDTRQTSPSVKGMKLHDGDPIGLGFRVWRRWSKHLNMPGPLLVYHYIP